MGGLNVNVNSGNVALVASVAKSILQVKAPANQRLIIKSLRIMGCQPAGGVDPTVRIRVTRSSANFGTFSAATTNKENPSNGETLQGTYGANATVEPTTPTDGGYLWNIQPQVGLIEFLTLDDYIQVPGGQSVQFECLSTGTPTLSLMAKVEE